jgi:hypothetical protein
MTVAQQMRSITTLNGSAIVMAAVCSAESPPARSRATARTAVASVKNTRIQRFGSASPPVAIMPITSAPESAEVTKKMPISRIAPIVSTGPGKVLEQLEQRALQIDRTVGGEHRAGALDLLVERRAAQHREPEDADERRHDEHAQDELAHRPPLAHARDEDADERRPRDPPAPVERRPRRLPLLARLTLEGAHREAQPDEVLQVRADRLHPLAQQVLGVPREQDEDEEHRGEDQVEARQPLHALRRPTAPRTARTP